MYLSEDGIELRKLLRTHVQHNLLQSCGGLKLRHGPAHCYFIQTISYRIAGEFEIPGGPPMMDYYLYVMLSIQDDSDRRFTRCFIRKPARQAESQVAARLADKHESRLRPVSTVVLNVEGQLAFEVNSSYAFQLVRLLR